MKKTRLLLSVSMLALAGLSVGSLSSCSKDTQCDPGEFGKNCTEMRASMIGSYAATDVDGANNTISYTATINKNPNSKLKVDIVNLSDGFFNTGSTTAIVTAGNINGDDKSVTFNIASQTAAQDSAASYSVSGHGSFDVETGKLDITYSITSSQSTIPIKYSGTWTKQ